MRFSLPCTLFGGVAAVLLSACGGGGGSASPPAPDPAPAPAPVATGLMVPPATDEAFVNSFLRGLEQVTAANDGATPPAPTLEADAGGLSTTYRLEESVDEHDVVKYDGARLFIAPTRGADCCYAVEPIATDALIAPPPPDGPREIRILNTDPDAATATVAGTIALDEGTTVEGMYLDGDTLIALTSTAWWGYHGDTFASLPAWEGQSLSVNFYDVTDTASPEAGFTLSLEGALVTSRRRDDRIVVVSRHLPSIPELVYYPTTDEERATNQAILDNLTAQDLLPALSINGEMVTDRLTPDQCLITDASNDIAPGEPGYPVITTVLSIDAATAQLEDVLCYAETTDGVYLSSEALYLSQTVYDDPDAIDSIVHQIDLDGGLRYRGSGRVAGSLVSRGQPDFRMSALDGVLRLVTTRWQSDEADRFDHRLFTLRLNSDTVSLEVIGQLPEPGSETVIGKANEDLFGVRFFGERAYLVTFERIDPLYVVDLSDPAAPMIEGELELPGFSELLHPVNANLLLGVGDDGEGRTKAELFDVSTPTAPASRGSVVLATDATWSYSEARYDRRAFTYLRGSDTTDRFTIPVSASLETTEGYRWDERLYMLEVRNRTAPAAASLQAVGALSAVRGAYIETRPRGIIDGDALYFVLGTQVWSGYWGTEAPAFGPF